MSLDYYYVAPIDDRYGLLGVSKGEYLGSIEEGYRQMGNYFETEEEAKEFAKEFNNKLFVRGKELTKDDEYYYCIRNSTHPDGLFNVARELKGRNVHFKESSMRHWGNYFETYEEARATCDRINAIIGESGISCKDKNGNILHMYNKVKTPDGEIMMVSAIAKDGSSIDCRYTSQDYKNEKSFKPEEVEKEA